MIYISGPARCRMLHERFVMRRLMHTESRMALGRSTIPLNVSARNRRGNRRRTAEFICILIHAATTLATKSVMPKKPPGAGLSRGLATGRSRTSPYSLNI